MSKPQLRVAVITISKYHFDQFCQKHSLNETTAKQVRILSDIKNEVFLSKEEIEGSNNVTDFVIKNVKLAE